MYLFLFSKTTFPSDFRLFFRRFQCVTQFRVMCTQEPRGILKVNGGKRWNGGKNGGKRWNGGKR